jgi:mannosyltransferase OCH1-like enzyme
MIPKIIHQTWKDDNIPEHWEISPKMWKKYHPDWEYILWTDKMIRDYIKIGYPEFLDLYDKYKYNIQRVDMIRYFILKDFGGIYSDLDLYPVENLNKWFSDDNDVYLVFSGNMYGCFTNSFMASKKNAPIWDDVLKNLHNKVPWFCFIKHMEIMYSTGPMFLSNVAREYKHIIGILPRKCFMAYDSNENIKIKKPEALLIPLEGKSWNSIDSHILNFINKHKKLIAIIFLISYFYFLYHYLSHK